MGRSWKPSNSVALNQSWSGYYRRLDWWCTLVELDGGGCLEAVQTKSLTTMRLTRAQKKSYMTAEAVVCAVLTGRNLCLKWTQSGFVQLAVHFCGGWSASKVTCTRESSFSYHQRKMPGHNPMESSQKSFPNACSSSSRRCIKMASFPKFCRYPTQTILFWPRSQHQLVQLKSLDGSDSLFSAA